MTLRSVRSKMIVMDTSDRPFGLPADIVLDLPAPPSVNNLYFNSARGGRRKTPHYRAWIVEAGWCIRNARQKPIVGSVAIEMQVEPNAKRDLDGHWKAVLDLLVEHRMIEGDRCRTIRRLTSYWDIIQGVRITVKASK